MQEMEPQKLVLVRGSPEETIAFGTLCQSILRDANIFKPTLGQVIELANSGDVLQVFYFLMMSVIVPILVIARLHACFLILVGNPFRAAYVSA